MLRVFHKNHSIPDVSLTALSHNKIYYFHDGFLHLYRIDSSSSSPLFRSAPPSHLFIFKSLLCSVRNSTLSLYSQAEDTLISLSTVPLYAPPYRVTVTGPAIFFIYSAAHQQVGTPVEIFTSRLLTVSVLPPVAAGHPFARRRQHVADITAYRGRYYVLTDDGCVYQQAEDTVQTRYISLKRPMVLVGGFRGPASSEAGGLPAAGAPLRLSVCRDGLLLYYGSTVYLYSVNDSFLSLQYSFECECSLLDGMACGRQQTVELREAPFLCVAERLYNYREVGQAGSEAGSNGVRGIGLAESRVYFMEEAPERVPDRTDEEAVASTRECTVNRDCLAVPAGIEDDSTREQYLTLEAEMRRYEMLYARMTEMLGATREKEEEVEGMAGRISESMEGIERKEKALRERISGLEERAKRIRIEGDLGEFRRLVSVLNGLLNERRAGGERLREHKERLLAQQAVLKSKMTTQ